jgi:peroxiredoxin Q/BCP
MLLNIGEYAPDFSLAISNDANITLSSFRNQIVVVYFYPQDDTPGCTIEAKGFNGLKSEFLACNAIIIGISKDNIESHAKFKEKCFIEFDLASDVDLKTCRKYGTLMDQQVKRTTFLIDKDGTIAHIWSKISVTNHAQEVLSFIKTKLYL